MAEQDLNLPDIVEIGPRQAVFGSPQHPYTRKLMAAVPVPDPSWRRLRRNLPIEQIRSPMRPNGYVTAERIYREVAAGHFVQA